MIDARQLQTSGPYQRPIPLAAAALLAGVVLVVDWTHQPGTGVTALYAVALLVTSYAGPPRLLHWARWLTTLLIVAGALRVPPAELPGVVLMNRFIALVVVWTTASIVMRLRETSDHLAASARDLQEVKYALDQSAIVAVTNTRGTITYVNDKFCEISKYGREELIGQDHRILNSGYHSKEFMRTLWHTIASGRIWRGEIRNRAKDASFYWVDTTIVPFLDARGKPYQYMAIRYEITARKQQEEQLREQASLTRLGEMAAVVAHEVKNPIAGIRGALQVLVSRIPVENRDRAIMGDIIARLDALNLIAQDLLLYSRPPTLKRTPVDLEILVRSTADLLRRDPALAAVTVQIAGGVESVVADREQMGIVLQNLLMNAAQAMSGQGTIDVSLGIREDRVRVAIRDHGPGMSADARDKAFDPFFTTKHRGTGLGLPIARRIVEAHGGRIDIDAAEGGGTAVTIELPPTGGS